MGMPALVVGVVLVVYGVIGLTYLRRSRSSDPIRPILFVAAFLALMSGLGFLYLAYLTTTDVSGR